MKATTMKEQPAWMQHSLYHQMKKNMESKFKGLGKLFLNSLWTVGIFIYASLLVALGVIEAVDQELVSSTIAFAGAFIVIALSYLAIRSVFDIPK